MAWKGRARNKAASPNKGRPEPKPCRTKGRDEGQGSEFTRATATKQVGAGLVALLSNRPCPYQQSSRLSSGISRSRPTLRGSTELSRQVSTPLSGQQPARGAGQGHPEQTHPAQGVTDGREGRTIGNGDTQTAQVDTTQKGGSHPARKLHPGNPSHARGCSSMPAGHQLGRNRAALLCPAPGRPALLRV